MHVNDFSDAEPGLAAYAEPQGEQSTVPYLGLYAPAPRLAWHDPGASHHSVQVYDEDAHLLDTVSHFIGSGLMAGEAAVVIATPSHRDELDTRLCLQQVDVTTVRAQGQHVALDAAETLAQFMVDGSPDVQRFGEVVGGIIARVSSQYPRVRVFGEMVVLLWMEGNADAVFRLEGLWNDLATAYPYSLLCAYPLHGFTQAGHAQPLLTICAAHSHAIPAESYTALSDPAERLRAIVQWQQKAQALETELAGRQALEQPCARTSRN